MSVDKIRGNCSIVSWNYIFTCKTLASKSFIMQFNFSQSLNCERLFGIEIKKRIFYFHSRTWLDWYSPFFTVVVPIPRVDSENPIRYMTVGFEKSKPEACNPATSFGGIIRNDVGSDLKTNNPTRNCVIKVRKNLKTLWRTSETSFSLVIRFLNENVDFLCFLWTYCL